MKFLKSVVGLAITLISLGAAAVQGGPCQSDVKSYCAQSGGGREVFECLLDHQQEVSDACYGDLKQRMNADQRSETQGGADPGQRQRQGSGQGQGPGRGGQEGGPPPGVEQCMRDVKQFCSGIQPGGGRIVNCLMDHDNEISDGCYEALAKKAGQGKR
jgi:hypothetical protein